jgi:redox-sensitive bicupin YhaK (pirin superfamily)
MDGASLQLRPAGERGRADFGWLDSRHTFSFGSYHDPRHMGFRSLRVINDDRVEPGQGFGSHPHADMEILSVVVSGALEHRDSLGTGSVMRPGEVQRMTAGTGILHSEFNPSREDEVHFLQIWIEPERRGLAPGYEQRRFDTEARPDEWVLLASREGRDGSLTVHQDVELLRARVTRGARLGHRTGPRRGLWIQVIEGEVTVAGQTLATGDGAAVEDVTELELEGLAESSDVLLFDLA